MALTGYHAKMSVARRPGSPVLVQLTTENGGLLLESNGVPGMIDIKMTPEETQALSRDSQYDLLLEAPDGEVVRALEGTVFVRRAVST